MDGEEAWLLKKGETRIWVNDTLTPLSVSIASFNGFKVTQTVLPGMFLRITGDGSTIDIEFETLETRGPRSAI